MSFGSVDVERDIPRKSQQGNERSIAITHRQPEFTGTDTLKNEYAHRSLRLDAYLFAANLRVQGREYYYH